MYTALKETESRATDVLPLWKIPALAPLIPRQRKALQAVSLIRQTTEELIAKCKEMVDAEEQVTTLAVNLGQQLQDLPVFFIILQIFVFFCEHRLFSCFFEKIRGPVLLAQHCLSHIQPLLPTPCLLLFLTLPPSALPPPPPLLPNIKV